MAKKLLIGDHRLQGYECFRDIYFSINKGQVSRRYAGQSIDSMFNKSIYSPSENDTAVELESTEKMKSDGYFFIPPRLICGDIVVSQDFNLVDEFSITIIANFLEVRNLVIERADGEGEQLLSFSNNSIPYYPLMDTILLGNLFVKGRMGYIQNPEQSITLEGMCVGMTPSFRADGIPTVTYKFRDVGWDMTRVNLSATYPNLCKDLDLTDINSIINAIARS